MKKDKKTIALTVYFFTDNMPTNDLKTAWECGVVHINANKQKGIKSKEYTFNDFKELPMTIKKVLDRSGINLINSKKSNLFVLD